MSRFLSIFVLLAVAVTTASSKGTISVFGNSGTNGGYFLGTVEGKSFFADNTTSRTWLEANTYCKSIGMRLASIKSVVQKTFLDGIDTVEFRSWYWTAGRDARTIQQFLWDHDNTTLEEIVVNIEFFYHEALTCLCYANPHPQQEPYFAALPCSLERGALCESI